MSPGGLRRGAQTPRGSSAVAGRTSDRKFQTLWRAVLLAALAGLAAALAGCSSPTAPSEPTHPQEVLIAEYVRCYAAYRGVEGEVVVSFEDDLGDRDCPAEYGSGARCSVAGSAMPYSHDVTFWGRWVRGETEHGLPTPAELAYAAAHEACHLSGIWSEDQAMTCADLIYRTAGCYDGEADGSDRFGACVIGVK